MTALAWIAIVVGSFVAVTFIPDWPWRHLGDPSHWGVIGYVAFLPLLVVSRNRTRREQSLLVSFLAAMPLIYIANALVFDASPTWLLIQGAGLLLFAAIALLGWRVAYGFIVVGLVGHGIWDLVHHGRTSFVPDWYTLACGAVDFGLAAFVALRLHTWKARAAARD
ncbi:MAG: hypothetical protein AAGE01_03145 [Pseudomonadota bacterium]